MAPPVATKSAPVARPAARVDTRAGRMHLEEMMAGTKRLNLASSMDELLRLGDWVGTCLAGHDTLNQQKDLIENSLFEVCANIIEHGYQGERGHEIDLWWVPLPGANQSLPDPSQIPGAELAHRGGMGYFVICDQGQAFDPTSLASPNLDDPEVRRRGRGLGWPIIYASMKKVVYTPETPAGNLTLLRFDPAKHCVR
jgi:anti-sigma regulatory factor (Ser/Thr protein kinase)